MKFFANQSSRVLAVVVFLASLSGCATATKSSKWRNLFDGSDTSAWRSFGGSGFPQTGWVVEEGCLHLQPGGKGGELVTVDEFDNFELQWEWKLAPKANNGIKYLVTEARPKTPGHEYQMVDEATMPAAKHQTASFYDVLPVQVPTKVNPPGKWNRSRLIIRGDQVEHWLNGVKVLAYELGSAETKAGLAQSKFKDAPGFGDKIKGRILLTNHKDETWYRHIRVRELSGK